MESRLRHVGWTFAPALVAVSAASCTAILGTFDFEGKPIGGAGGTASTSPSGGSGGTMATGGGGATTTSTTSGSGGAAPACDDGAKDGDETGIDCGGGTCPACAAGQGCMTSTDCQSGICSGQGVCATPTCTDGVNNGSETGVDCGGATCAACASGEGCNGPDDCQSSVCTAGFCQAPTCTDGILNGVETDMDCGGPSCRNQGYTCAFGTNCAVDADCAGTFCVMGKCDAQTLAVNQSSPWGIAVDLTNVYWTTFGGGTNGTVIQLPLTSMVPMVLASAQPGPRGITINTQNVYWCNNQAGTINRVAINGGTVTTLASGYSFPSDGIAVNGTNIFWADGEGLWKSTLTGGSQLHIASAGYVPAIVLDAGHVYWANSAPSGGAVMSYALQNGEIATVAAAQDGPLGIAVDATNVYWTQYGSPSLFKQPLGGGVPAALTSFNGAAAVVVDANYAYWLETQIPGSVVKSPIAGGPMTTLAFGQAYPKGIAIDANYVYWTNKDDGTVKRIHK